VCADFFSPANVMKLLEVVRGAKTSPEVIATCMDLGKKIKKQPVLAGNCFGFIGNRMLEFYGREAFFLVEEGATPRQIDSVLKSRVGLAMGFFEMSDLAGNDVGWRLRKGFNLVGMFLISLISPHSLGFYFIDFYGICICVGVGENATGRKPGMRYCSLPDQLCDKEWFGQKTQKGWYVYDPSAPRKPLDNEDAMDLIANYRQSQVGGLFLFPRVEG
jgi:3-hydroxyacyl-CoA dehydrogenase